MSLVDRIKADKKTAMLARNGVISTLLGTLLGAIQSKEKTFNPERPLTDDEVVAQIKKLIDGATETVRQIDGGIDPTRYAGEREKAQAEIATLSAYMPQQLDEAAVEAFLQAKLTEGITGMGPLMAALKAAHAGAYDGKMASTVAKRVLG